MNETIETAALIRDVERVLAEWAATQAQEPVASAVVRGMSVEIRGVLYRHFAGQLA